MMCITEQVIVFVIKQRHNVCCHLSVHFFAWTGVDSLLNFIIGLSSQWFFLIFLPFPSLLVWNLKGHRITQCDSGCEHISSSVLPLGPEFEVTIQLAPFNSVLPDNAVNPRDAVFPAGAGLWTFCQSLVKHSWILPISLLGTGAGMSPAEPGNGGSSCEAQQSPGSFLEQFQSVAWCVQQPQQQWGLQKGRELWLSKRFKLAGRVMVALGVLWFGSLFIHKLFCLKTLVYSGEPLFCKSMRSVKWKQSLLLALCFGLLQQSRFQLCGCRVCVLVFSSSIV